MFKCCKKGSGKSKTSSVEKLEIQQEVHVLNEEKRAERTRRNIEILREDLYQGIMKPFFASG